MLAEADQRTIGYRLAGETMTKSWVMELCPFLYKRLYIVFSIMLPC